MNKKISQFIEIPADNLKPLQLVKYGLAIFVILSMLLQLFKFEKMPELMTQYGFPGGLITGTLLAIVLILTQLIAMPYLLSLSFGRKIEQFSRWSLLALGFFWWFLHAWAIGAMGLETKSFIGGAVLNIPANFIMLGLASILFMLTIVIVFYNRIKLLLDKRNLKKS